MTISYLPSMSNELIQWLFLSFASAIDVTSYESYSQLSFVVIFLRKSSKRFNVAASCI